MNRTSLIGLVLLLSGCGSIAAEEPPIAGEPDTDAGVEVPAPAPTPVTCYCCVWAPGTSYPNGDVVCLVGSTIGAVCEAARLADAVYPEWVPEAAMCETDDPWGANS